MGIQDDIKELQVKAGSYEMLKDEFERVKRIVKEATDILNKISGSSVKGTSKYGTIKPVIDKLYEKMKIEDNFQVTKGVVEKEMAILGLDEKDASGILYRIGMLPGVQKAKDGIYVRLFYIKPVKEDKITKVSAMGGI